MRASRWAVVALCAGVLTMVGCQGHRGGSAGTGGGETTVTSAPAGQGELPRVIIKQFSVSGISDEEASGVSAKFCVEVSKCKKIELICAEDLQNLFKHQQDLINFGACNEKNCLAEMGKKLDADFFIQPAINKVGETFVVNVNLVEGASGAVKKRLSQEVDSGNVEDLLGAAEDLAGKIVREF